MLGFNSHYPRTDTTGTVYLGLKTCRIRVHETVEDRKSRSKAEKQCCRQTKTDKRALKQRLVQEESRSQFQPPNKRNATNRHWDSSQTIRGSFKGEKRSKQNGRSR